MNEHRYLQESELISRLLSGDESVFPEFYSRYFKLVISCVRKVFVKHFVDFSEEEVDDTTGHVFLNLVKDDYRKLRLYDNDRGYKFSSWIGLISTNTAYDILRKRKADTSSLNDDNKYIPEPRSSEMTPPEEMLHKERINFLLVAVEQLSDQEKRFLELSYEHDLSPEEIAFQMGLSLNTVYSKKNKIKVKLTAIVKELMEN